MLGQQAGPESTATRGHLRRSEAARSWTRSLLDSLDTFYANGLPAIPEGGARDGRRGREPREPRDKPKAAGFEREPSRRRSPPRPARRSCAGASSPQGGVLAVILVAVLLWPLGVLTGGDDDEGGSERASAGNSQEASTASGTAAGVAVIAQQDDKRQVVVQAANLPATKEGQAYEVWLYNSPQDAKSMGAQVTDDKGRYQGAGPLPGDYARYKFVDISLEPIDNNRAHSGQSVLRGQMPKLKKPPANLKKGTPASLGQVVLLPPEGPGAGAGGSSLPGFMTPAGSRRSLAARSTSTPSSPTSARSQGAWSRPTAWWWVIVPPPATIASRSRGLGRTPLVQRRLRLLAGHEREVQRRP